MKHSFCFILFILFFTPRLNAMAKTDVRYEINPQLKKAAVVQLVWDLDNDPQMTLENLGFDPCIFAKNFHRIRIKNNRYLKKQGSFKGPHTPRKRNSPSHAAYKTHE